MQRKSARRSAILAGMVGALVVPFAVGAVAAPQPNLDQADAEALQKTAPASTGAVIVVKDGDHVETYSSGTVRFGAQEKPTADHRFRVGSNTKMFVATVVLQLVEEGKLELDGPIGDYLPGLVVGGGLDEQKITVRHLLQQTGGLADYDTDLDLYSPIYQVNPPSPEEVAGLGLRHGSQSTPGSTFSYANTNYVVLGLLIEEVTGKPVGEAFDERIIGPLGLSETTFADTGDKTIDGPHFRGYLGIPVLRFDLTGFEPGLFWAAGSLVSSGSDLNVFTDALLSGKLLDSELLEEMKTVFGKDDPYGLGLIETQTDCGKAWGHNGVVPGYFSQVLADGKGRSVYVAVNNKPSNMKRASDEVLRIANAALCGTGDEDSSGSDSQTVPVYDESTSRPPSLKDLAEAGFYQVVR